MSIPDDRNVTMVVIEIEPGRIFVKVAGPRPGPERLELLLQRTIEHWFSNRPQFVIDRSQAVADDGEIQGIDV